MSNVETFKKELANPEDWYPQATNAVPIFINSPAKSGFDMKKVLGFGYSKFMFRFQGGWGEMFYYHPDLDRLWLDVKRELDKDKDYLKKIRIKYNELFNSHKEFLDGITIENLRSLSDDDLLSFLKKTDSELTDACGIGHIIEPISLRIEEDFKVKLHEFLKDDIKFKKYFTILTAPTSLSFIAQEENNLYEIFKEESDRDKKLQDHINKYSWIQNNYSGPIPMTRELIEERAKEGFKKTDIDQIVAEKESAIEELNLPADIRHLIEIIDFTTVWQDERKANIVMTIGYLDLIIEEISKRIGLAKKDLYYLSCFKVDEIKSLDEIKNMKELFGERRHGVFFLVDEDEEISVTGDEYREVESYLRAQTKDELNEELHGSISNPGTAIGPASVCTNLESIGKVKEGDVLIASMTRPEYMPAIRKAIAIITDEGGITCHAAIVSREMNIPCIVGTKKATQIFKDGDMIEVRANHGIVRKIKSSS